MKKIPEGVKEKERPLERERKRKRKREREIAFESSTNSSKSCGLIYSFQISSQTLWKDLLNSKRIKNDFLAKWKGALKRPDDKRPNEKAIIKLKENQNK